VSPPSSIFFASIGVAGAGFVTGAGACTEAGAAAACATCFVHPQVMSAKPTEIPKNIPIDVERLSFTDETSAPRLRRNQGKDLGVWMR
jgi:hypothetical protein